LAVLTSLYVFLPRSLTCRPIDYLVAPPYFLITPISGAMDFIFFAVSPLNVLTGLLLPSLSPLRVTFFCRSYRGDVPLSLFLCRTSPGCMPKPQAFLPSAPIEPDQCPLSFPDRSLAPPPPFFTPSGFFTFHSSFSWILHPCRHFLFNLPSRAPSVSPEARGVSRSPRTLTFLSPVPFRNSASENAGDPYSSRPGPPVAAHFQDTSLLIPSPLVCRFTLPEFPLFGIECLYSLC